MKQFGFYRFLKSTDKLVVFAVYINTEHLNVALFAETRLYKTMINISLLYSDLSCQTFVAIMPYTCRPGLRAILYIFNTRMRDYIVITTYMSVYCFVDIMKSTHFV